MIQTKHKKIARTILAGISGGKNVEVTRLAEIMKGMPYKEQTKVIKYLKGLIHEKEGIIQVKVISPEPLRDDIRASLVDFIKKKTKAKDIVLSEEIDKALIAGMRILVGDTLYDNTVKSRLKQLRNKFR